MISFFKVQMQEKLINGNSDLILKKNIMGKGILELFLVPGTNTQVFSFGENSPGCTCNLCTSLLQFNKMLT